MVRAPCCEKMGMKKGPWTNEEDQILINFIHLYGHGNWRALPKLAGLMRCGKSCRLRWTNYLRPDIKRGNFSREEEETIIKLHEILGNRWSAIAARLPGRTDNEIKNVWHTHLKKRVKHNRPSPIDMSKYIHNTEKIFATNSTTCNENNNNNDNNMYKAETPKIFREIDESFWSEVLSDENSRITSDFPADENDWQLELKSDSIPRMGYDGMDFWYNIFNGIGELPEI